MSVFRNVHHFVMKESFYSWNEYSFLFQKKAQDFGISTNTILGLLKYSENLSNKKLPIIYDLKHFSFLTGFRDTYLRRAIERPQNFYRTFKIPKKNGHTREITEPLPGLKEIQYWILTNILQTQKLNIFNNAYAKGKSIVTNAKFHTKQPMVLNMDIEKYFDNISYAAVKDFFTFLGYNQEVSHVLASLLTLSNGLPQGSPTSPYLSSLLTFKLDEELFKYCREWKLRYSRYADDITVSGNFHSGTIIRGIKEVIAKHGFNVNSKKTRVKKQHQRQMVTGIVVNKKLSVKKSDIKKVRQEVFYIRKYGIISHAEHIKLDKRNYIQHLLGKINFYVHVKKKNQELLQIKEYLKEYLKANKW